MKIFSNEDIRAIDSATIEQDGVSARELIERVAAGVTAEIMKLHPAARPVAILAGSGNNGADALAVARMLMEQGCTPAVYLFNIGGNRLSPENKRLRDELLAMPGVNLTEVTKSFSMPDFGPRWLVIDGLFGTGLRDAMPGGFQSLARTLNESGATVVSIDVPSGLFSEWNAGNSRRNIIRADLTIAIQFPRLAFMLPDNAAVVGRYKVLDIGLSRDAIMRTPSRYYYVEEHEVRAMLPMRPLFCSKADFGSLLLAAGSYGMMGAAVLAAKGALRAGVGKLTVHSARVGYPIMQSSVPEALFNADKFDIVISDIQPYNRYSAIAVGPGIGVHDATIKALETLLVGVGKPVVLDADALNCIARRPAMLNHLPPLSIITPHAGEFDRLFGTRKSTEERLLKAIEVARTYNIIVVLKGYNSVVVSPDGKLYFNSSGSPAMATAGSGDVLTGVIGALLAQGLTPGTSAIAGVFIHGLAGEMAAARHGDYGVIAGDIADNVGRAINYIMNPDSRRQP